MIRTVNIILSMALVMQTIGCASQGGLIIPSRTQNHLQKDAWQKLKKGMYARIIIRKDADAPFKDRNFECIIEQVGSETLTIIKTKKDVLQEFEKGMQAKIKIRKDADVPFSDRTFECTIEEIGPNTITVTKTQYAYSGKQFTFHHTDISSIGYVHIGQKFTLQHADILSIEYEELVSQKRRFFARTGVLIAVTGGIALIAFILYLEALGEALSGL